MLIWNNFSNDNGPGIIESVDQSTLCTLKDGLVIYGESLTDMMSDPSTILYVLFDITLIKSINLKIVVDTIKYKWIIASKLLITVDDIVKYVNTQNYGQLSNIQPDILATIVNNMNLSVYDKYTMSDMRKYYNINEKFNNTDKQIITKEAATLIQCVFEIGDSRFKDRLWIGKLL